MGRVSRRTAGVAAAGAVALSFALVVAATPARAVPPPPFGEFYGISPATALGGSELAQIGRARARTLRALFYWPSIEPDPPAQPAAGPLPLPSSDPPESKQWAATDRLVGDAARNGIRVLPFVYGSPDWIASDPMRPPLDGDADRAAWQDLLTDLVARYGPDGEFWREHEGIPKVPITTWQVWNEPNSQLYWAPEPSPAEYAELLRLSSAAIRSADPGAAIALAGMFGTPQSGVAAWEFLAAVYAVPGSAETFDAYALHPYAPGIKGLRAQVELVRDIVRDHGDRRLPLLISEIGWPTGGPPDYNLVKSLKGQKRMLAKAFRLFLRERRRWKLERVIWYTWRDNDVQPNCSVCSHSGLFSADLEPKPAWRKFTQFTGGQP